MRYIDAEKAIRKIVANSVIREADPSATALAIACIKQTPTADVRDNVRGEWLPMKRFGGEKGQTPDVMCSVCHAPALWLGTLGCIRSNYCPNCGADMRG